MSFLKIALVISNQAIAEAMKREKIVPIIDFSAVEVMRWRALFHGLSARPEGTPHLRITCDHQQKEVLDKMALILIDEPEKLDVSFQFDHVVCKLENSDLEKLRVKTQRSASN